MTWLNRTFVDALHWGAKEHPTRLAVISDTERLTFPDLLARVDAFAAGLLEIGVKPGDKVGLWLPDCVEWLIARWAIPSIGAVLVPINTRFRDAELRYVLKQCDCRVLIMRARHRSADYRGIMDDVVGGMASQKAGRWEVPELPELRTVIGVGSGLPGSTIDFAEVSERGQRDGALAAVRRTLRPADIAQILYTSGTTSFPKGAMVRHCGLLQNNFNAIDRMKLSPETRYLCSAPLFSATGTSYTLYTFLAGGALVLMDGFSAEGFCQKVEQEGVTGAFLVEPMVQDLRAYPRLDLGRLSTLRTGTGSPLSSKSLSWIVNELGVAHFTNAYGLSESSNAVCRNHWSEPLPERLDTMGLPMPGIELRIDDLETEQPLPAGKVGQIRIRGFNVTAGYYNMKEETEKAIDREGWLRTGDLGELRPDGRLIFRGRIKEMIKPGGFNVATLEIEQFLKTHPDVREAVLVGVDDTRYGEVGYAFVEREPGSALGAADLIQYCKRHIAGYKVPRTVEFVTDWPLTSTGKIKKLDLKARANQRAGARVQ